MRPNRLQNALVALGEAMREVNAAIEEMRGEHDPLASHIFVTRRQFQNMCDTKSGKRHHLSARLSWQQACDLGFRGELGEWQRLMGSMPGRLSLDPRATCRLKAATDGHAKSQNQGRYGPLTHVCNFFAAR